MSAVDWRSYYESKSHDLDEHAATYGSSVPLASQFYGARWEAVAQAVEASGTSTRSIEIGCGSGAYMPALRKVTDGLVVAVDLSGGYVRQTVGRAPFAAGVEGDGARLGFRDGAFDLVLATEVIEHLERPVTLLDEARRVLRAGGALVLSTPNPIAIHDLMYRVKRRIRGYDVNEHPGLMLPWSLRRALTARGFRIEQWRTCNFAYPYPVGDLLGKLPRQEALARATARLERTLQRAPVVERMGWTQVVLARREGEP